MQYEESIAFLNEQVLNLKEYPNEWNMDEFYGLIAENYFSLEDFEAANRYYEKALKEDPHNSDLYVDYAISLAEAEEITQAEELLEKAEELGVSSDRSLLTKAEIKSKKGNREDAETDFKNCIKETEDAYITLRAYIIWSRMYNKGDERDLIKKTEILQEALTRVENSYQPTVLEQLIQVYIDLGDLKKDTQYYQKAIDNLYEIIELGWDSYITYNNIGILYEKTGDYESAKKVFVNILEAYGKDYKTYKRLAFLELDIQSQKSIDERNYAEFDEYYQLAKETYQQALIQNEDMEMQLLEQYYKELKSGNWL